MTDYGLDNQSSITDTSKSRPSLRPSQLKAVGSFPGVKPAGSEADRLTPPSVEAENTWILTSVLPYNCLEWGLGTGKIEHYFYVCAGRTTYINNAHKGIHYFICGYLTMLSVGHGI